MSTTTTTAPTMTGAQLVREVARRCATTDRAADTWLHGYLARLEAADGIAYREPFSSSIVNMALSAAIGHFSVEPDVIGRGQLDAGCCPACGQQVPSIDGAVELHVLAAECDWSVRELRVRLVALADTDAGVPAWFTADGRVTAAGVDAVRRARWSR